MKEKMLTNELQVASRAKQFKGEALANLHQYIDVALLSYSFSQLNRHSSAGVDGQSWYSYGEAAPQRLPGLLSAFKPGKYQAPPIRRVYIPKGKTGERPLGLPTIEDKVLQSSARSVLEPIYEEDFKDFSYGFRSNRSCHQAIESMFKKVSFGGMRYIIDADIQDYFGRITRTFFQVQATPASGQDKGHRPGS